MIQIVKNIVQSRIKKSWTSRKQTDDIYTTKTDYKKTYIREKAEPQIDTLIAIKTPSPPAIKSHHHLLRNAANTWQINEKAPTLSPILTIKSAGLAWAR